jgi:hypothetical protein
MIRFHPGTLFFSPHSTQQEAAREKTRAQMYMLSHEDVFENGHFGEKLNILKRSCHPELSYVVRRKTGDINAVKKNVTLVGPVYPTDDVEHRCLSGAVRTDQGKNLPLLHVETAISQSGQAAEMYGELSNT